MASMWRRTMLYLGLGPDEDYEDYDESGADRPGPKPDAPAPRPAPAAKPATGQPAVRPLPVSAAADGARPRAMVRPVSATAKPGVVSPTSFDQAQEVGDKFKASQPVIVNLQGADRDLSRRIIDFASGLCYGLGGQMEKVAGQVYLLTPTDVEVSAEERRRLQERGFDG